MGRGIGLKCSKCGNEYSANTGIGFLYPQVYQKTLEDIKNGKYGKEWKDLALSEDLVAVDAESYLYICGECGHWDVEKGLSLYIPNDVNELMKKEYGDKTVKQRGEVPYVMSDDLRNDYHLLKGWDHKCPKCGASMHMATRSEETSIPCPACGAAPVEGYTDLIRWD